MAAGKSSPKFVKLSLAKKTKATGIQNDPDTASKFGTLDPADMDKFISVMLDKPSIMEQMTKDLKTPGSFLNSLQKKDGSWKTIIFDTESDGLAKMDFSEAELKMAATAQKMLDPEATFAQLYGAGHSMGKTGINAAKLDGIIKQIKDVEEHASAKEKQELLAKAKQEMKKLHEKVDELKEKGYPGGNAPTANPDAPLLNSLDNPAQPVTIDSSPAKKGIPMTPLKIYRFGKPDQTDGSSEMKDLLGGKAANLAGMCKLGIPVPPGYTFTTEACMQYLSNGSDEFVEYLGKAIAEGEDFLLPEEGSVWPPLVSVRSGARVSMPGMMDTILNIGLTSASLPYWKKKLGDRAALDSYRRLIQMYGSVVANLPMDEFEDTLAALKIEVGATSDLDLDAMDLQMLVERYLLLYENEVGSPFPDTRMEQLRGAILAVFSSWNNQRAVDYRAINGIPFEWGTSATVQSMVFGNADDQSCTGVLFTRDPSTGKKKITGEWLPNAQGEDVVAGLRTPLPIDTLGEWGGTELTLQLSMICATLEKTYKDMQDIEFTVQSGKLYILQTRNGKRSARAAFEIAYQLVSEEVISKETAVSRITPDQLLAVLRPEVDPAYKVPADFTGIAAGGSVVTGSAVFTAAHATNFTGPCILVREETDPDDFAGMAASVGILTATGGLTSHAAVVARGMDKTCVVGCTMLDVKEDKHMAKVYSTTPGAPSVQIISGTKITMDGMTGRVWVDKDVPVIDSSNLTSIREVCLWAMKDGTPERLDSTPDNIKDALATAKSKVVYVDTCMGDVNSPAYWAKLASGARVCPADRIILDMSSPKHLYAKADAMFDWMFGQQDTTTAYMSAAAVICTVAWGPAKPKLVFRGCSHGFADVLKGSGFAVATSGAKVYTVADLMAADDDFEVPPQIMSSVFGGSEAYNKLLKMLNKSGGFAPPRYWFEPMMKGA